jgi:hypothetical protein
MKEIEKENGVAGVFISLINFDSMPSFGLRLVCSGINNHWSPAQPPKNLRRGAFL